MTTTPATDVDADAESSTFAARPRRNIRAYVAAAVVLAALGLVLFNGLGNATLYFKTADEAVRDRESLGSRRFRIEGTVVPGTLRTVESGVAFAITEGGVRVDVLHRGDPPQLFREGIPVVLEGHFSGQRFASDRIMVKHSEEYKAENPERVGDYAPRRTPATR